MLTVKEWQMLGLKPRDAKIAYMACEGKLNKEIGESLGLATTTIRGRLSEIYSRFSVSRRSGLVAKASLLQFERSKHFAESDVREFVREALARIREHAGMKLEPLKWVSEEQQWVLDSGFSKAILRKRIHTIGSKPAWYLFDDKVDFSKCLGVFEDFEEAKDHGWTLILSNLRGCLVAYSSQELTSKICDQVRANGSLG